MHDITEITCITREQCEQYRAEARSQVCDLQEDIQDFKVTIAVNNALLKNITKLGWFILTSILLGFLGVIWTQLQ